MVNWIKKISESREAEKSYRDKGKTLWEKYSSATTGESKDVMNIFNPNTDILLSALYNNTPKPDIRRRFAKKNEENNKKDSLYRTMASVADYAIQYNFERQMMSDELKSIFLDGLITGRGVGQLVYDYEEEEVEMQDGFGNIVKVPKVVDQTYKTVHVEYQDFAQEICKKQKDVTWQARMHLFTKKEMQEEFELDEDIIDDIEFTYSLTSSDDGKKVGSTKYAQVWEVWDKVSLKRIYVCASYESGLKPLKEDKDPLRLEKFFPFDIFKTIDNGKDNIPTAEYCVYESLNKQLQRLVKRAMHLTNKSIKHVTVANSAQEELQTSIKNATDGDVVGVDQSPSLGAAQQVGAIPIAEAILVKNNLDEDSSKLVTKIWEITGISDIMRGGSNPLETATAQKQKGVFGTLRIQERQKRVQEFIRSCFGKMSEAVCEFSTIEELQNITCIDLPSKEEKVQTAIALQSGAMQPSNEIMSMLSEPTWEEVKAGLTDDRMRGYTINIQSTATVFDDVEAERKQIAELSQSTIGLLNQSAQLIAASPSIVDLMEQFTVANLSTYKTGRNYTDNVKELFAKIKAELSEPKDDSNPVLEQQAMKEQADIAIKQERANVDKQKVALDAQYKEQSLQLDRQKAMLDAENDKRNTDIKQAELLLKKQELDTQAYLEEQKIRNDIPTDANLSLGGVADLV